MNLKNRSLGFFGLLLFSLGALTGIFLYGMAIWADLESFMFDSSLVGNEPLSSYSCPILITSHETGIVKVNISNHTDRVLHRTIRSSVTEGLVTVMRRETTLMELQPGETKQFQWEVKPADAVYGGHFILTRAYLFASYPLPSRAVSCGILVANIPMLTGGQVVLFIVVFSLITMPLGFYMYRQSRPGELRGNTKTAANGMIALTILTAAGLGWILTGGTWLVGVVLLVLSLFLIIAILTIFSMG